MEYILDEKGYIGGTTWKHIKYIINNNCWECTSHNTGDRYALVRRNNKREYMHRYIYNLYHGEIPENYVVMHSCDNPKCINPGHLLLGTHKDNSQDMAKKGRSNKGKNTIPIKSRQKLSDLNKKFSLKQLLEIKQLIINGKKLKDIALIYNCHYATLSAIKNGKSKAYSEMLGGGIKEWKLEGKDE